jgi:hypothetical protein
LLAHEYSFHDGEVVYLLLLSANFGFEMILGFATSSSSLWLLRVHVGGV